MSDLESGHDDSGSAALPSCPECESQEVRASRSSYPRDKERTGAGTASFWRCAHCGSRFLGPHALSRKRRRHSPVGDTKDPLNQTINFWRKTKRWLFPLIAILTTIAAVIYILDRRDPEPPQFIFPD